VGESPPILEVTERKNTTKITWSTKPRVQKKHFFWGVYLHPPGHMNMQEVITADYTKDPTAQNVVTNKNTNAKHWFGIYF